MTTNIVQPPATLAEANDRVTSAQREAHRLAGEATTLPRAQRPACRVVGAALTRLADHLRDRAEFLNQQLDRYRRDGADPLALWALEQAEQADRRRAHAATKQAEGWYASARLAR